MGRMVGTAIVYGLPLLLRLTWPYLRMKRKAQKAGALMKKELMTAGMSREMAEGLVEQYLKTSRIVSQVGAMGFRGARSVVGRVEIHIKALRQCSQQVVTSDLAAIVRRIRQVGSKERDSHGSSDVSTAGLVPLT